MTVTSTPTPTVYDATEVAALEWLPFPDHEGVEYKLLWSSGWSVAGLMRIRGGAVLRPHVHAGAHHHLWVQEGDAEVLGRTVGPGSYLHIPAGVLHGITKIGPGMFSMLYLYLRDDPSGDVKG
jgi:hypothetical protein